MVFASYKVASRRWKNGLQNRQKVPYLEIHTLMVEHPLFCTLFQENGGTPVILHALSIPHSHNAGKIRKVKCLRSTTEAHQDAAVSAK